jgi:excisionase family DNA binding protein
MARNTEIDERALVVDVGTAGAMLGKCKDRVYDLLRSGELESYRDGRSRRITVASIKRYVDRQLALSRTFTPGWWPGGNRHTD